MKSKRFQASFDAWPSTLVILKGWRKQGLIQGVQINLAIKAFDEKKRAPKRKCGFELAHASPI